MKRKKTLLILSLVLLVAVVAIVAEKAVAQHIDKINTVDEEVFSVKADDISQISITKDGSTAVVEKVNDTWKYTGDTDFPVSQDYVADILSKFESVHASFIIDDVEDYSQYGISNPEGKITFTTDDGEEVITFGAFSTIDEKRYICVDGGSVYLIDEDLLEDISGNIEDYLDRDDVFDYSQITAINASGDSELNMEYNPDGNFTYTDAYDYYAVDDEGHKALSESKILSYINTLEYLDLSEYETYKAKDSDLSKYGLDKPTLTVKLTGEVPTDDSDDSDSVESKTQTLYFAHKDGKDKAYLYFEGSSIVYTITSDDYDEVVKVSYEDLRPDEVVSIDWTKVAQISSTIDGDTNIVDVKTKGNDGNTYKLDGESVDYVSVTSDIDSLNLSEVGESYKKGTEELAFAITLDDKDATVVNVVLYQYDGDSCVVAVDDKVVGLCSRSSISKLREDFTSAILNKGKEE